jgi:hypothetical protein
VKSLKQNPAEYAKLLLMDFRCYHCLYAYYDLKFHCQLDKRVIDSHSIMCEYYTHNTYYVTEHKKLGGKS